MTGGSLRLRILALSALSIGGTLLLLSVLLTQLFERQIAIRFYEELAVHLGQLTRAVETGPGGAIALAEEPFDPRFSRPFSGLYWQVSAQDSVLASASLWDETLDMPPPGAGAQARRHERIAFGDGEVMAAERVVALGDAGAVRLVVAVDRATLETAKAAFADDVLRLLALLGLFLLAASGTQIHYGLRPLARLRQRLSGIIDGSSPRLGGRYPAEVQALVDELNALIRDRETGIAVARARASDLAHGLKTPLAVLSAESRRLRATGEGAAAAEIEGQVARMTRHVERELTRARIGATVGAGAPRTPLAPAIERLIAAVSRLPRGDALFWPRVVDPTLSVAMEPADLDEVLGNLLENACKWAASSVTVTAAAGADGVTVAIEDDGPGIPAAERKTALERGGRLDGPAPGSGLGLAIVRDILDPYGGSLRLGTAASGGLAARIEIPAPRRAAAPRPS